LTSLAFPGPFSSQVVVVDGWRVPLLQAQVRDESITLVLDDRCGATFTMDEAERVVPFLAHCIASDGACV
jgi:hypothetical protein